MKLKWKPRKLTIMIIPEANSAISKFRLANFIIYSFVICVLGIFIYTCTLSLFHTKTQLKLVNTINDLELVSRELHEVTYNKTEIIDQLQIEVILLSDQAQLMKIRIEEMTKLEEYMKSIVLSNESKDASKLLTSTTDISIPSPDVQALGGESVPSTPEEILKLGDETEVLMLSLSEQLEALNENINGTIEEAEEKLRIIKVTPTIWPTDSRYVTSGFGYRKDPFTGRASFHDGIDITGDINDPIYAGADGFVVNTGSDSTHGRNILIEHSKGMRTWYMHLSRIQVKIGERVTKGQVIGRLGSTGRSTGPHLHYQVIKNGVSLNPVPYLKTSREEAN
jgi:murein DD-endopeptidase MepM/ murein hydrolase activator NlpD